MVPAVAVALLGSPLDKGASAATPPEAPAATSAPGGLVSNFPVGDSSCDQPTTTSGGGVTGTGRLKAGLGLLGDDSSSLLGFLGSLGSGAIEYGEGQGLGWVLSLLGAQQPSINPAQVASELGGISTQLGSLSQQEYADCKAVLTALDQLNTEVDKDAYHNQVVIMDEYVTDVEVYQQDFDDIVTALQQNGGNIAGLSTTLKADLEAMVSGGTGSLQWAINEISAAELGGSSGADGMAQLFAKVLTDELGYDPYETHIFPAAFVNGAYAQIGYYAGVVDQAAYLYSNAAHLKFSAGSYHHPADPNSVVGLVNAAQADLQAWSWPSRTGPSATARPLGSARAPTRPLAVLSPPARCWTTASRASPCCGRTPLWPWTVTRPARRLTTAPPRPRTATPTSTATRPPAT